MEPTDDWSGLRVKYDPGHKEPEFGTVQRMATGKEPCAFVLFDGDTASKLCYIRTLEVAL